MTSPQKEKKLKTVKPPRMARKRRMERNRQQLTRKTRRLRVMLKVARRRERINQRRCSHVLIYYENLSGMVRVVGHCCFVL